MSVDTHRVYDDRVVRNAEPLRSQCHVGCLAVAALVTGDEEAGHLPLVVRKDRSLDALECGVAEGAVLEDIDTENNAGIGWPASSRLAYTASRNRTVMVS